MTQQAQQEYQRWLSRAPEFAKEINAVANDEEMEDRFGRILDFGTGGLRGKMGAGSNRMNNYNVARATQGLANYLLATAENPSVVIARDTRNNSAEYSKKAAQVLCAAGIKVYWYENPRPTPMLSHATRYYKASAGIVITASHNEKCDNGYKVYNADGGQITDIAAGNILAQILDIDLFDGWKCLSLEQAIADELLTIIPDNNDCDNAYFELLRQSIIRKDLGMLHGNELSILYTPLYGSGNGPVRHALDKMGYGNVSVIDEQAAPNGDFPGLEKPNPEDIPVYAMAIEQAKKDRPDLIFATDPDCDRIGVLTQDNKGEYSVLTGNQTGCLLVEYLLESHIEKGTLPPDAALIKTIVTTDLAKKICGEYNVKLIDVLTGFKYIGEKIYEWNDENKDSTRCSFLYGFEESYGHLTHTFARDKDAVAAGVIIAQKALWGKLNKQTLYYALPPLWA
ncbi:MAG: phospho-sugar mutase [Oscillospiraceae bacterium]|nr:phospho-sugar mutase [Oscillospiraceae bacterium]